MKKQSSIPFTEGRNLSVSLSKIFEIQTKDGRVDNPFEDLTSDDSVATATTASSSKSMTADTCLDRKGSFSSKNTPPAYRSAMITIGGASFDSHREALCKHYDNGIPSSPDRSTSASSSLTQLQSDQRISSGVHPEKDTMKRHRRDKTATFGMVGAGVGTLILPVVGTVVGGVITGYATNQTLKRHERKVQRKWERDQFQRDADASQTARHAVFV